MNRISMVTRRDIRDLIISGRKEEQLFGEPVEHRYLLWGRLNPVEFLERLYSLREMPTVDGRCKNAEEDIRLHTIVNPDDYVDDWIFEDERFQLMSGNDAKLLDFLCAIFHPEVRDESGEWKWLLNEINILLRADSYVLCRIGMVSGRDVYGWRDTKLPRFKRLPDEAITVFDEMFYSGGYVLGFDRRADFEEFTYSVIGVGLCERYQGLSMGKSLRAFLAEGTEDELIRLFGALLCAYEKSSSFDSTNELYFKCRQVMKQAQGANPVIIGQAHELKTKFTSEYLQSEIEAMIRLQKENPTDAIGKAKELIESCCKTILEECGVAIESTADMGKVVSQTTKILKITPEDVPEDLPAAKTMKALLGNLRGIAGALAELRNSYGSGHGKSVSFRGLKERHAKLAVGSSVTLIQFLWDSFERMQEKKQRGNPNDR